MKPEIIFLGADRVFTRMLALTFSGRGYKTSVLTASEKETAAVPTRAAVFVVDIDSAAPPENAPFVAYSRSAKEGGKTLARPFEMRALFEAVEKLSPETEETVADTQKNAAASTAPSADEQAHKTAAPSADERAHKTATPSAKEQIPTIPAPEVDSKKRGGSAIETPHIEKSTGAFVCEGRSIALTALESRLMSLLLAKGESGVTAMEASALLSYSGRDNLVAVYVCYLRKKTEKALGRRIIFTSRFAGYYLKF